MSPSGTHPPPPIAGATCPRCRHDLRGSAGATCPECGADTSSAALARAARWRDVRRRWAWSGAILLPCIYAPYLWIFVIDAPWGDDRLSWALRFPVLPGIVPTAALVWLVRQVAKPPSMGDGGQLAAFAMMTAIIVIAALWLGSRGRRWLVVVMLVTLIASMVGAWGAWAAFVA